MRFFVNELDGKRIAYSEETMFYIQIDRYKKGSYRTRYSVKGNLGQAVMYFNGINIGLGYKARILVPSFNNPVLARKASI